MGREIEKGRGAGGCVIEISIEEMLEIERGDSFQGVELGCVSFGKGVAPMDHFAEEGTMVLVD